MTVGSAAPQRLRLARLVRRLDRFAALCTTLALLAALVAAFVLLPSVSG